MFCSFKYNLNLSVLKYFYPNRATPSAINHNSINYISILINFVSFAANGKNDCCFKRIGIVSADFCSAVCFAVAAGGK